MFTAASYQSRPPLGALSRVASLGRRAAAGLPAGAVGRRPRRRRRGVAGAGRSALRAGAAGRGLPTDGEASRPASEAPEQPRRAGRPRPAQPRPVAQVAVVGDDQQGRRARRRRRAAGRRRPGSRITASAVRAAAVADGQPGRDPLVAQARARAGRRRRARWRRAAGMTPRSRPISAAGGAAAGRFATGRGAGSSRRPAGAGSRRAGRGRAAGIERHRTRRRGARLRSGRWASSCWSTSTASSTAARDPVPGVAAVLADRAARGDDVVYVTNNSMHYRADYQTRLAAMGAPVSPDTVVSSARATAAYLRDHDPGIRRVLVLGGERAGARAARRRATTWSPPGAPRPG